MGTKFTEIESLRFRTHPTTPNRVAVGPKGPWVMGKHEKRRKSPQKNEVSTD
jgi:hypothetical protein